LPKQDSIKEAYPLSKMTSVEMPIKHKPKPLFGFRCVSRFEEDAPVEEEQEIIALIKEKTLAGQSLRMITNMLNKNEKFRAALSKRHKRESTFNDTTVSAILKRENVVRPAKAYVCKHCNGINQM